MHLATPEILNSMISVVRSPSTSFTTRIPAVHCEDGLVFSMQASEVDYCRPRDNIGPWHEVEIGFPSEVVEEFLPYIDGDDPLQTVYGFVPLEVVCAVINKHGGLAPEYII